jgi:hypothetical protein
MSDLYHVSAFAKKGLETHFWDGMMKIPGKPNLADGWLSHIREVVRDLIAVNSCQSIEVSAVTIISISRL